MKPCQKKQNYKVRLGKIGNLVIPQNEALKHEAANLIMSYTKDSCPVDCSPNWTKDQVKAAMIKGPNTSSTNLDALHTLHEETIEKVQNGYAAIIQYGDFMHALPEKLNISLIAMIPHKSRAFCTILDLFFRLGHRGKLMDFVNSSIIKMAPTESIIQLGNYVQHLIAMLADNYNLDHPFMFSKLGIKDGFWRIAVSRNNAWNLYYVLPSTEPVTNIADTQIVVPN